MHADDTPHCRCKTWYLYKSRQAINKVEMQKKTSKIIGAALAAPAAPVPTPLVCVCVCVCGSKMPTCRKAAFVLKHFGSWTSFGSTIQCVVPIIAFMAEVVGMSIGSGFPEPSCQAGW